jgi:membrane protease YdiL (CAAX protease family)
MSERGDQWQEHAEAVAADAGGGASGANGKLPAIGWGPWLVAMGIVISAVALLLGTIPIAVADPELESTAAVTVAQLVVALALAGTALGFALADANGRLGEALRRLGLRGFAWRAAGLAVAAWFLYLLLAAGLNPLLEPDQEDVTRELGVDEESTLALISAGLLIIVAAPISEEVFFRGFMFAGFRRVMPMIVAGALSAVFWGMLHLSAGNIGVAVQLSVFGLILAVLYERTGTLWAPILAHAINNAIAFTLLVTDVI